MGLLEKYRRIFSVNNLVTDDHRIISLPLGIVDTAEKISFATCRRHRDFSLWKTMIYCRNNFREYPRKVLYMNYRIPKNLKVRLESPKIADGLDENLFTDRTKNTERWLLFDDRNSYVQYFKELLDHVFVQCPSGFGIDSYRFYETLYLGRIPVVLKNPVTEMFHDLPVLFLDRWEDFGSEY